MLGVIALFDEAREIIKAGQRRADRTERDGLIERALTIKGSLHKMDTASFHKLVTTIYEEIGYRTKAITVGKEQALLLAQKEVYTLVGYKNHGWPISRDTLETLYHHKKRMGLDAMIMISTGGFNHSAWEWAKDHDGVKLINEENFIDLCNEIATQPTSMPTPIVKDETPNTTQIEEGEG